MSDTRKHISLLLKFAWGRMGLFFLLIVAIATVFSPYEGGIVVRVAINILSLILLLLLRYLDLTVLDQTFQQSKYPKLKTSERHKLIFNDYVLTTSATHGLMILGLICLKYYFK